VKPAVRALLDLPGLWQAESGITLTATLTYIGLLSLADYALQRLVGHSAFTTVLRLVHYWRRTQSGVSTLSCCVRVVDIVLIVGHRETFQLLYQYMRLKTVLGAVTV
jgi:hypothetical protein